MTADSIGGDGGRSKTTVTSCALGRRPLLEALRPRRPLQGAGFATSRRAGTRSRSCRRRSTAYPRVCAIGRRVPPALPARADGPAGIRASECRVSMCDGPLPLCGFLGQQGQQSTAFVDVVSELVKGVGHRVRYREAAPDVVPPRRTGSLVISDHSTPTWKQLSSTAESNETLCGENEFTPLRSSTKGFSARTNRSASAVTRSMLVSSMTPVDRHHGGQLAAHRVELGASAVECRIAVHGASPRSAIAQANEPK